MFDLEALQQSGIVMLVGMAVIFLFLILLIFVINFTVFLSRKLGWGKDDEDEEAAPPSSRSGGGSDDETAAIAAAVAHHAKAT